MGRNNEGDIKPCYTCGSFYTSYCWYKNKEVEGTFNCTQCHFAIIGKANGKLRKGTKSSQETKDKISRACKGRKVSKETRIKLSNSRRGFVMSDEQRKLLSIIGKGRKTSEETRRKLSIAGKGKCRQPKEHFQMLADMKRGIPLTDEVKLKISKALTGRKLPIEVKNKLRGRKALNNKGDIMRLNHVIRTSEIYIEWRNSIFERDDYTCQLCYKRGGNIHAHHIVKFATIIEIYKITKLQDIYKCDLLWDISNGITYCEKCHRKIEREVRLKSHL